MAKLIMILMVVAILLSLAIPVLAGNGNPKTERQGEQTGQAKQAGPNGPNYGNPESIISPVPPTQQGGMIYTLFVPFVSSVQSQRVISNSMPEFGIWK